uniref:Peptidase M14 domain-containing protein n=1 Tax=Glossina morsitans morsitans TaxID=37546 RepID=A0A1B0FK84_GLOMM
MVKITKSNEKDSESAGTRNVGKKKLLKTSNLPEKKKHFNKPSTSKASATKSRFQHVPNNYERLSVSKSSSQSQILKTKTCKKSTKHNPKRTTGGSERHHIIPRPDVLHTYLSHCDIIQYLDFVKSRFSDSVKIHTIGYSYEKRAIKAIEIDWINDKRTNDRRDENLQAISSSGLSLAGQTSSDGRNTIFIEGGTHAREWISISVALNCIYQLTEKNLRHRDLLGKLRFFIVPLVNPDGYEYTRTTNPRWRKNRRPHSEEKHIGTDCNRNFDFHWDLNSSKVKRNTYQGEKPFSEPETRALAKTLHRLSPQLLFFLSLHSYATTIMYPWGYTRVEPKNAKMLENLAITGSSAIRSSKGRYYRVGTIANITKRTIAGSVVDYAYGVIKVPLALVMELPSSEYGFQPPSQVISQLGHESWIGIKEMCKYAFSLKTQLEDLRKNKKKTLPDVLEETVSEIRIHKEKIDWLRDEVYNAKNFDLYEDAQSISKICLSTAVD